MACCGRSGKGGTPVVKVRKKEGDTYFDQFGYLTPQQLQKKREMSNAEVFCTGCGPEKPACPARIYFKCAKRIAQGL